MNKKHLAEILEQARLWTNAEYDQKTTPETDSYHTQKLIGRLQLLNHIADTYIEQRENAQL